MTNSLIINAAAAVTAAKNAAAAKAASESGTEIVAKAASGSAVVADPRSAVTFREASSMIWKGFKPRTRLWLKVYGGVTLVTFAANMYKQGIENLDYVRNRAYHNKIPVEREIEAVSYGMGRASFLDAMFNPLTAVWNGVVRLIILTHPDPELKE